MSSTTNNSIRRAFKIPNKNLSSGDRTSYLKAKVKYNGTVNLVETLANPPSLKPWETSKANTYNGTYILTANQSNLSNRSNYCLSGSRSYSDLLDITKGKYLLSPPPSTPGNLNINNVNTSEIYNGNFFVFNYQGVEFKYDNSANIIAPDNIRDHYYVDPSYQIFYNGNSNCKVNNYFNYVTLDTNINAQVAEHNIARKNLLEGFEYPIKFSLGGYSSSDCYVPPS